MAGDETIKKKKAAPEESALLQKEFCDDYSTKQINFWERSK
jgi:hypothetical protein